MTEQEMLAELKNFDTPSITNVVATYPGDPLCLGLYKSLERKLVHGSVAALHVSRAWPYGRLRGHLHLRPARPQLQRR